MKKSDIMDELDEAEIEYDPKATKAELEALLPEEEEVEVEEEEEAEEEEEETEEEEEATTSVVGENGYSLEDVYEDVYKGRRLGLSKILSSQPKKINGRQYIELMLDDSTTTLLSERDLKKQSK